MGVGSREKIKHFQQVEAWQEELKYFLILSKDLGYIDSNNGLMTQSETVGRLLNGLITSTEKRR